MRFAARPAGSLNVSQLVFHLPRSGVLDEFEKPYHKAIWVFPTHGHDDSHVRPIRRQPTLVKGDEILEVVGQKNPLLTRRICQLALIIESQIAGFYGRLNVEPAISQVDGDSDGNILVAVKSEVGTVQIYFVGREALLLMKRSISRL